MRHLTTFHYLDVPFGQQPRVDIEIDSRVVTVEVVTGCRQCLGAVKAPLIGPMFCYRAVR